MARYIAAVIDLQFGSTGKGQIAGSLALKWKPDTVATAWGPNAGHTFRNGQKFQGVSTMLASSATAPSIRNVMIGPGSVINMKNLAQEIEDRDRHMRGKHLIIHPQAVILMQEDADAEKSNLLRIGSTMKGTAEATIRKIRRMESATAAGRAHEVLDTVGRACVSAGMSISISSNLYDRAVDQSERLILEGAQGFSLGLHTDFYPHCTGRDVSTAQLFADCRIPWPGNCQPSPCIVGVARTYPIRVANRYESRPVRTMDGTGDANVARESLMVGSSGGWYDDQQEISWDKIGRNAELTTVTRLPRRLFTFSHQQIQEAARVCRPTMIALTFCDYLDNKESALGMAKEVSASAGAPVRLMAFGPDISDLMIRSLPTFELTPFMEDDKWVL